MQFRSVQLQRVGVRLERITSRSLFLRQISIVWFALLGARLSKQYATPYRYATPFRSSSQRFVILSSNSHFRGSFVDYMFAKAGFSVNLRKVNGVLLWAFFYDVKIRCVDFFATQFHSSLLSLTRLHASVF